MIRHNSPHTCTANTYPSNITVGVRRAQVSAGTAGSLSAGAFEVEMARLHLVGALKEVRALVVACLSFY